MARPEDIHWSMYQTFEGPFYRGKIKFELSKNITLQDKYIAAITSIESGHYDAINMYDRMIMTVGLIQWGEANTFSVSKLLGAICDDGKEHIIQEHLRTALKISNSSFRKNPKGIWRFYMGDSEVNNITLQQQLFLGCNGQKGKWTNELRTYAKTWAAAMASVFEDPKTYEIQKKFTIDRLMGFVSPEAKKLLFDDKTLSPWADATRAIYLTFAINLPRIAGEMLTSTKFIGKKWSQEWCISLIKRLTFGPNIKIYPTRYNALRPVIERLFNINLPKNSLELENFFVVHEKEINSDLMVSSNNRLPVSTIINSQLIKELNEIVIAQPIKLEKNPSFLRFLFDTIKKIFLLFVHK
jgi:hypothetical protein